MTEYMTTDHLLF